MARAKKTAAKTTTDDTDNIVKFGDTFYLQHNSGQYIVAVDRGEYNYPQLGNIGKVALQLIGGREGEAVNSQSRIKIKTTESVTAENNILGAFANRHDCYYWQDGYDEDKQSWVISKFSGESGPIYYDDQVYLTNCSYTNQRLIADTSTPGYITTAENVGDWWVVESTVALAPAQESADSPTVALETPSLPATAPPNVAPSPAGPTQQTQQLSSNFYPTCTDIFVNGNVLSATCNKVDGSPNQTSLVLMGIENIDGQLIITDPNKPSSFQDSCTNISVNGNVLSATCNKADGSPNQTSLVLDGIENIDGTLTYTGASIAPSLGESASASPNVAPSPAPVSSEQFRPLEASGGLGHPASAPPNVAPPPTSPAGTPSPPVTPTPAIAQPIPPVKLQGRQKVLVFDANQPAISVGSRALRPQGNLTIEAWIHPATDAGKQIILADGETLFYLEGGELKFQTPLSSQAIASSGAGITAGSWYHVAVTRAGSLTGETKLYINGVENDNQAAILPVLAFGDTYLGGQADVTDTRFQGKLLEVRVWRFARSQDEIRSNLSYPLTGRELGLVRCWSLNESFGNTVGNRTTYQAVGTIAGEVTWEEAEIPLKLKLDPQERLTRSTGLEDYGYWYREMAKQQNPAADPLVRRGRIWA